MRGMAWRRRLMSLGLTACRGHTQGEVAGARRPRTNAVRWASTEEDGVEVPERKVATLKMRDHGRLIVQKPIGEIQPWEADRVVTNDVEDQLVEAEELSEHLHAGKEVQSFRSIQERDEVARMLNVKEVTPEMVAQFREEHLEETVDMSELSFPQADQDLPLGNTPPPPFIPDYDASNNTPNVDWRYFKNAGTRVDGVHCPGCGIEFQAQDDSRPGYLLKTDFDSPTLLRQQEKKPILCHRCSDLKFRSRVDAYMTFYGASKEPGDTPKALVPEETVKKLSLLRGQRAVVIYLVDAADIGGSCFQLSEIIGTRNPVIVGVTKCDTLPHGFSVRRLREWVERQCRQSGLHKSYDVHFLDVLRGVGVTELYDQAAGLARYGRCNIFVVGAVNAGKSAFVRQVLQIGWRNARKPKDRRQLYPVVSRIGGSTLELLPVSTGDGMYIYDTPGVALRSSLALHLTPEEQKYTTMGDRVTAFGHRLDVGRSLLFGGFARVDNIEGRAVLCNFFCPRGVKVVPCDTKQAESYVRTFAGTELLYPPLEFDEDFNKRFGWSFVDVTVEGDSWRQAARDIVVAGLGWVGITVKGSATFRVKVPEGVSVSTREPLLPFEGVYGAAKYTGYKWVNKYKERYVHRERRVVKNLKRTAPTKFAGDFPDLEQKRTQGFKGFRQ